MTEVNINGNLTLDQSAELDDDDVDYRELSEEFRGYLEDKVSDEGITFARTVGVVISPDDEHYVTVTPDGSAITNLYFSDANGALLNGEQVEDMQTVDGENVYLWSDSNNTDIVLATTSDQRGEGSIVAAFHLIEESDHLSARIEMATFIPLKNPDPTKDDGDTIDFSDVLNVTATASRTFNLDVLDSGNFLWAAVGNSSGAVLITGKDLNVEDMGTSKEGAIVKGGSNPSDTVNTSQGGKLGATIGINNQTFTPGSSAVFTLVSGFTTDGLQAHGTNVKQIDYDGYLNTNAASISLSQLVSSGTASLTIAVFSAGGGTTPEEGFAYIGDEGGKDGNSGAFKDDTAISVVSVTVRGITWGGQNGLNFGDTQDGITVTLDKTNTAFSVTGLKALDTVAWATSDNFNRFHVTANDGPRPHRGHPGHAGHRRYRRHALRRRRWAEGRSRNRDGTNAGHRRHRHYPQQVGRFYRSLHGYLRHRRRGRRRCPGLHPGRQ